MQVLGILELVGDGEGKRGLKGIGRASLHFAGIRSDVGEGVEDMG